MQSQLGVKFALGFLSAAVLGPLVIPFLRKIKAGQSIREDGPGSHLAKEGTPTIGGLIFLLALLIGILVFRMFSFPQLLLLFSTLGFGAVGFIDDYIKVVKKRNLGLTALQKLLLQILISVIIVGLQKWNGDYSSKVLLPFSKKLIDLGVLYIPFIIFVIVGTVNSVNLTDGLDGLSSGVTIIILIFFTVISKEYGNNEISEFAILLAGSLLGFLLYNKYPAKVFMGDTGSLALGGAIASIAVVTNLTLILPIAGGIYFVETLSVILQVLSFKRTGKRIFLMAPLHHHYEQKGWKEVKVVLVFYAITFILVVFAGYILL